MFIKSVYDLIGALGIVGGNHLGTVGTVEKQHVNDPPLLRSRALHITGLNPESTDCQLVRKPKRTLDDRGADARQGFIAI